MYSAEGEEVQLSFSIYPSSNVEDWLREVEHSMKTSVRDIIERAIKAYPTVSRASPPSTASQPTRSSVCSFLSASPLSRGLGYLSTSSSDYSLGCCCSQSARVSLGAKGPWGPLREESENTL